MLLFLFEELLSISETEIIMGYRPSEIKMAGESGQSRGSKITSILSITAQSFVYHAVAGSQS